MRHRSAAFPFLDALFPSLLSPALVPVEVVDPRPDKSTDPTRLRPPVLLLFFFPLSPVFLSPSPSPQKTYLSFQLRRHCFEETRLCFLLLLLALSFSSFSTIGSASSERKMVRDVTMPWMFFPVFSSPSPFFSCHFLFFSPPLFSLSESRRNPGKMVAAPSEFFPFLFFLRFFPFFSPGPQFLMERREMRLVNSIAGGSRASPLLFFPSSNAFFPPLLSLRLVSRSNL